MNYKNYLDKVYGCWLGKCICGSIGAPLEGCKQIFDYKFDPSFWKISKPNDDLELQILWLNLIEKTGLDLDSDDLAQAFLDTVPYNPGEYAYFKRNYRRGIHPPSSGTYNNHFYHEGMGCCIRAEIWACLAAGDPQLAGRICRIDGQLDHSAESIYSESFIAAMEAAAFVESDPDKLIEAALSAIPENSKLAGLVRNVQNWCREEAHWKTVHEKIIRHYGHPDCTNMFENIGITIMALLKGNMNIQDATLIALNSGFDTDCTCGIAGAIIGIIAGAEKLQQDYGMSDTGFVTNFDVHRSSDRIEVLASDIARLTLEAERFWKRSLKITDAPAETSSFRLPVRKRDFRFESSYEGMPVLNPGGKASCTVKIFNLTHQVQEADLELSCGKDIELDYEKHVRIEADSCAELKITVRHLNKSEITDKILINASFKNYTYSFGFAAAVPWKVYGPYWNNFSNVPQVELEGKSYQEFIRIEPFSNRSSAIRNYHLNSRAGLDISAPEEEDIISGSKEIREHGMIYAQDDLIPVDGAFGYQGPGVFYLVSEFISHENMKIFISIGRTCPLVFCLDGKELARADFETYRTPENINLDGFELSAGKHRAVFKIARQSETVKLSVNYKTSFRPKERVDAHITGLSFLA